MTSIFSPAFLSFSRVLLLLLVTVSAGRAQTVPPSISLLESSEVTKSWTFNNGAEFPGATGGLTSDASTPHENHPSLKLTGDFTKGGKYVQAGRMITGVDPEVISLWLKNPEGDRLTVRLNDGSGQTHQIALQIEAQAGWQHVIFPLEKFFTRRGQADAVTNVAKYESWGGAKDGKWHGPAKAIYLLISPSRETQVRNLWLGDVTLTPKTANAPGVEVTATVPLDPTDQEKPDWDFSDGREFPGAKGTLTVLKDTPEPGRFGLSLSGDFRGGGAYVATIKNLQDLEAKDVSALRMRVRGNAASLSVQLVDGSGHTHQRKELPLTADGAWHDFVLEPKKIAGGEHWGGANDGQWHGPARQLVISLTTSSDPTGKQPKIDLADIRADVTRMAAARPAALRADFENLTALPGGWQATGQVALDPKSAAQGKQSLALTRTLENINQPCSAVSPTFAVTPGVWQIGLSLKSALHSADNSYRGTVTLESLDRAGTVLDRMLVAEVFGQRDWQTVSKSALLPKGAVTARLRVELEKADGQLWLDDLRAAYLAPAQKRDDRISRILFSTAQLGNLLLPADPRRVDFVVEALRPLSDDQLTFRAVVRDYWGAEQAMAVTGQLEPAEKKGGGASYRASVDLSTVPLDLGRYYEVHVEIPQGAGTEPFRQSTSFAILPEAETKRYRPEEIPFTSRNWDNRITEYIKLSDRLGIRICGLWGGWSAQPPYTPEAPGLDLCRQLGMGWLTTTPAKFIEQGKTNYTEEGLRQGVRNLIEKFGKERPMILNLGNEPHGTGAKVLANVAAYKAIYEEAKKTDPSIPVVATSVEPNEEYFKAGYGQWCDAFDFHIYESHTSVRHTIEEYRALMKKYGCEKPIWSTELGLNSQGMTRRVVAAEVFKKTATFFAAGGANMSWFGLLYPDPDGKSFGSSGDSHNVFDCRYKCYSPRLDAVALYHAVNAIGIKKFVAEQQYPDGVSAFLFRDREGRSLQIVWKDRGRQDIGLPLVGVKDVRVVQLDGRTRTFQTGGESVTLTVSEDPLLLLYEGGTDQLPPQLVKPLATLLPTDQSITAGAPVVINVAPLPDTLVEMEAPPFWTSKPEAAGKKPGRRYTVTPPAESAVHTAVLTVVVRDASGKNRGELTYAAPISR